MSLTTSQLTPRWRATSRMVMRRDSSRADRAKAQVEPGGGAQAGDVLPRRRPRAVRLEALGLGPLGVGKSAPPLRAPPTGGEGAAGDGKEEGRPRPAEGRRWKPPLDPPLGPD